MTQLTKAMSMVLDETTSVPSMVHFSVAVFSLRQGGGGELRFSPARVMDNIVRPTKAPRLIMEKDPRRSVEVPEQSSFENDLEFEDDL
jgi:hypothetical protein